MFVRRIKFGILFLCFVCMLMALAGCSDEAETAPTAIADNAATSTTTAIPATNTTEPATATAIPSSPIGASPTATVIPTDTATPEPTATATPDIPPLVEGQPLEHMDLYAYNLATGVWTEGQGLAQLLGLYVGAIDPATVPHATDLTPTALTPLIKLAQAYVKNGDDATAIADLQGYLNSLLLPESQLELYAQPEEATVFDPHSDHLARLRPARQAGTPELCRDLYAQGFPPNSAVICFNYRSFNHSGKSYKLYYPSYWAADDPRRAKLDIIMGAVQTAVPEYNSYGPAAIMPTSLVLTELAGTDENGRPNARIYAAAVDTADNTSCRVGIFPSSLVDITDDELQQSIAHELFHCYQYTNLTAQESGPTASDNEWWVEGSAEYFSERVYPSVDFEYRWLGSLSRAIQTQPLTQWSYKSFIFFEYLANNEGKTVSEILALLTAMPTSGGQAEQLAALSGQSGIQETFQNFARALADDRVQDHAGNNLLIGAAPIDFVFSAASDSPIFRAEPFQIGYYEIRLAANKKFSFVVSPDGQEGRSAVRPSLVSGAWGAMPSQLDTCHELDYRLVVTSAVATPEHELTVSYQTLTNDTCDECLLGTWVIDNNSFALLEQAIMPPMPDNSDVELVMGPVTGRAAITFAADGTFSSVFDQFTQNNSMIIQGTNHQLAIIFGGGNSGTYQAMNDQLNVTASTSNISVNAYLDGQTAITIPNLTDPGSTIGGGSYVCSSTTLIMGPNAAIQAVNPNAPNLLLIKEASTP